MRCLVIASAEGLRRVCFHESMPMRWLHAIVASLPALAMPASETGSAVPFIKTSGAARTSFNYVQAGAVEAIDSNRHCQTVRECRFARGAKFRGCISAYSCRTCQFVPAPCTISGRERTCQRLRCHWGFDGLPGPLRFSETLRGF